MQLDNLQKALLEDLNMLRNRELTPDEAKARAYLARTIVEAEKTELYRMHLLGIDRYNKLAAVA